LAVSGTSEAKSGARYPVGLTCQSRWNFELHISLGVAGYHVTPKVKLSNGMYVTQNMFHTEYRILLG
jgi:hypothetical protein